MPASPPRSAWPHEGPRPLPRRPLLRAPSPWRFAATPAAAVRARSSPRPRSLVGGSRRAHGRSVRRRCTHGRRNGNRHAHSGRRFARHDGGGRRRWERGRRHRRDPPARGRPLAGRPGRTFPNPRSDPAGIVREGRMGAARDGRVPTTTVRRRRSRGHQRGRSVGGVPAPERQAGGQPHAARVARWASGEALLGGKRPAPSRPRRLRVSSRRGCRQRAHVRRGALLPRGRWLQARFDRTRGRTRHAVEWGSARRERRRGRLGQPPHNPRRGCTRLRRGVARHARPPPRSHPRARSSRRLAGFLARTGPAHSPGPAYPFGPGHPLGSTHPLAGI
jgi:hypothetical protein